MQPDMPVETALRVYRRYLKLEPSHTEEYIAYLKSKVLLTQSHCLSVHLIALIRLCNLCTHELCFCCMCACSYIVYPESNLTISMKLQ